MVALPERMTYIFRSVFKYKFIQKKLILICVVEMQVTFEINLLKIKLVDTRKKQLTEK